jgi:hypothetical protein
VSFQFASKDGKLLIVNISLYLGFSLEAVNNKLQTYLGISHAGCSILFFKLCHAFLTDLPIFFIDLLDKFLDFLIIQLQIIDIIWVEEPVLSFVFTYCGNEKHPMVRNTQHEPQN